MEASKDLIVLRPEQIQLIEDLALVHESMGLQPAMSKIMALLTVSDEVELTFDQIRVTLNLSKSAISQALNQLLVTRRIAYKTRLGGRKRYFHIRVSDWEAQIMEQFTSIAQLMEVYKRVLSRRPDATKEFNHRLEAMIYFLSFIHNQANALYRRYQEEKKG